MSENKVLSIINVSVIPLAQWLGAQQLHGKESRYRTRFIRVLSERAEEMEKERISLCVKYSETKEVEGKKVTVFLDKDGKDTTKETELVKYKIIDQKGFNEEYSEYLKESLIIDVTPATKDMINSVKETLLNTNESFKANEAALYDGWCEAFEAIK